MQSGHTLLSAWAYFIVSRLRAERTANRLFPPPRRHSSMRDYTRFLEPIAISSNHACYIRRHIMEAVWRKRHDKSSYHWNQLWDSMIFASSNMYDSWEDEPTDQWQLPLGRGITASWSCRGNRALIGWFVCHGPVPHRSAAALNYFSCCQALSSLDDGCRYDWPGS